MSQIKIVPGSEIWKEWRERCIKPIPGRRSALYFLIAKVMGLEDKIPVTIPAHYSLCMFAERATGIPEIDSARIQLIQVPRGFGKSAIVTTGLALQRLLAFDDYSIGIANEKQELAEGFLAVIKQEFETNDLLRVLFPERFPENFKDTTWKTDRIVIPRKKPRPISPSVLAAGANSTVTGVHLDEWFVDDVISDKAAENALRGSFSEIEATNRWVTRLSPLLCSPERDKMSFIGTPWYEGDTYEFIEKYFGGTQNLDEPPDFQCIWSLKLPGGHGTQHIPLYRRGDIAVYRRPAIVDGRSIFPERWTLEELEKKAARPEEAAFFQANYMLKPAGGLAATFKPEHLKTYEIEGAHLRYHDQSGRTKLVPKRELTVWISVDPAFSDKNTSARTAIPVVGSNGSELFLLEDFAEHGMQVDDTAHKVVDFVMQYPQTQRIFVETIVAQVAVADAIRRVAKDRGVRLPVLHEIPSHGKERKTMRIFGMEPYFKKGIFYAHPSHHNFRQEYNTFPRAALRDVLDAVSFQKDEWERVFMMQSYHGQDRVAAEQQAIARLRAGVGRGGGY